jgi:cold-inducible RNA-binding protein
MKLYVGNLPRSVNDEELLELVKPFGEPESARVIMDRGTGESRGFGFVEFRNDTEARAAINGLNGKEVGGRSLVVNEAREQKGGSRGGGGGGRGGQGGGGGYGGGRGGGRRW